MDTSALDMAGAHNVLQDMAQNFGVKDPKLKKISSIHLVTKW